MRTTFFPILENERSYQLISLFFVVNAEVHFLLKSTFQRQYRLTNVRSLVEQKGFWPMHVSCKQWKPGNQEKNSVQHRDATTNKGELPSRT